MQHDLITLPYLISPIYCKSRFILKQRLHVQFEANHRGKHKHKKTMATVAEIRQMRLPEGGSYPEEAWDRLVNSLDRDLAEIKSVGSAIVPEVDYKGCYSVFCVTFH